MTLSFSNNYVGVMGRETIHTDEAPKAVGPYSQAVICANMVYTAGQIGLNPATGKIEEPGVGGQTRQVMANLAAVLKKAGASFDDVVKSVIYLVDLEDFALVNEVYAEFFQSSPPARSTVQVAALPLGALVEIDMIATVP